jgi:L-histidine N-alpha-methyltransferase
MMGGQEAPDPSFLEDVRNGLGSRPKALPSVHLYDAEGDRLFQRIMNAEDYYPARAEASILREQSQEILQALLPGSPSPLNIVELGAGDGSKTKQLLEAIPEVDLARVRYVPNDISGNVLEELKRNLEKDLPSLRIEPLPGDHRELLPSLPGRWEGRKVVLFLGGNIGNYDEEERESFLRAVSEAMELGDRLLIGLDKRKDPRRIHRAYDDREGVTRAFNLNVLERMKRELGADLDPGTFLHHPIYDPELGEARSYLVSTCEQTIRIEAADMDVPFEAWEPIFIERSKKFAPREIEDLAERTGFRIQQDLEDPDGDFRDSVWVKV